MIGNYLLIFKKVKFYDIEELKISTFWGKPA